MIFTDSIDQQVFKKPRLGGDNLLFDRSGNMKGFGKVLAGATTGLGAAIGGSKGAQMGASVFGSIAELGSSGTADQSIQDNYQYSTDRTIAQAMIPAGIYGSVVDSGREVAKAVLTGGASIPGGIDKMGESLGGTMDSIQNSRSVLNQEKPRFGELSTVARQQTGVQQFQGLQSIRQPIGLTPTDLGYLNRSKNNVKNLSGALSSLTKFI